jgi:hypothetical protein
MAACKPIDTSRVLVWARPEVIGRASRSKLLTTAHSVSFAERWITDVMKGILFF